MNTWEMDGILIAICEKNSRIADSNWQSIAARKKVISIGNQKMSNSIQVRHRQDMVNSQFKYEDILDDSGCEAQVQ